jgi:hypothetical protein
MARQEEELTNLVVEGLPEQPVNGLNNNNPTVLSCGGIYVPRPRPFDPKEEYFKIINIANEKEPTKIVGAAVTINLLQNVLHKESMN